MWRFPCWTLSSCRVLIHYFFHHKLMPLYLNNSSNDCYVTQHKNRIYTFLHFLATRLRTQKAVCAQHCHECRHQPRLDLLACRMPAWVSQLDQQPCISMRAQSVIWLCSNACTRAIFVAAPWPVLFFFQLDRAQSHAAREAQVFLDNKHIQTLTWTCCPESEIIISTYSAARVFLGQQCWALRLDNQTLLPCQCLNLNRLFIICLEM